jgi:hypothetical protein
MRLSSLAVLSTLLGLSSLFSGCCSNTTCDCQDELADAVKVRFKTPIETDSTGFSPAELDTIRLVRARIPTASTLPNTTFRPDTFLLARTAAQAGEDINIANARPFAFTGLRISGYRYQLLVPQNNRRKPTRFLRYDLTGIMLKGGYNAEGCCTCYENTEKNFYLKTYKKTAAGTTADSTLYQQQGSESPAILLTRPR